MEQIPREANEEADYLARMASEDPKEGLYRLAPILELNRPSYEEGEQVQATATVRNIKQEEESWQTKIKKFLTNGDRPEDKKEARRIQIKVARYTMMNDKLHQKSWDSPMLKRCLTEKESLEVMKQIHKGVCGNHTGRRSLAHKAMTQGYF